MFALPPRLRVSSDPEVSGVACPDCCGVLGVRADGDPGHLTFVCRIGHAYSLADLIGAKEDEVEQRLGSALLALSELAALLRDADRHGTAVEPAAVAARAARLERDAARIRRLVEEQEPLDLAAVRGGIGGGRGGAGS